MAVPGKTKGSTLFTEANTPETKKTVIKIKTAKSNLLELNSKLFLITDFEILIISRRIAIKRETASFELSKTFSYIGRNKTGNKNKPIYNKYFSTSSRIIICLN